METSKIKESRMVKTSNYLQIFNNLPDNVLLIDPKNDAILDCNNTFLKKAGLSKRNVIGRKCYEVIHKKFSPCGGPLEKCPLKETLRKRKTVTAEHIHYDKHNNPYSVEVITSFIKPPSFRKKIILHICRTGFLMKKLNKLVDKKSKEYLAQIKYMAVKDPLTGTFNYRYIMERLPTEVYRAKRYNEQFSLALLDIDYFKSVNETYGYHIGDLLLAKISDFIKKHLRQGDILARYGQDEFMILMIQTDKLGAQYLANRILTKLTEHVFKINGMKIKVKVSIGIATLMQDASCDDHEKLLNALDLALQRAKDAGGNVIKSYSDLYTSEKWPQRKISTFEEVSMLKRKVKKLSERVDLVVLESIYAFSKSLEARDFYTAEHAEEMVTLVLDIGKIIGLSQGMLENLERGAMLHDIGKIGISDSILRKKAKLTAEEYMIIKSHPKIGAEIIRSVHFLRDVVPVVLYHHERWDGKGYPSGLKEREIPLLARIVSIADAYQALISDRPYRKAFSKKEALEILKKEAGTHFDKDLVNVLINSESRQKRLPHAAKRVVRKSKKSNK